VQRPKLPVRAARLAHARRSPYLREGLVGQDEVVPASGYVEPHSRWARLAEGAVAGRSQQVTARGAGGAATIRGGAPAGTGRSCAGDIADRVYVEVEAVRELGRSGGRRAGDSRPAAPAQRRAGGREHHVDQPGQVCRDAPRVRLAADRQAAVAVGERTEQLICLPELKPVQPFGVHEVSAEPVRDREPTHRQP
jgi:hypothetical protein